MRTFKSEKIIQEYLEQPKGSERKAYLEKLINQDATLQRLVQEQEQVISLLSTVSAPDVPADMFTGIQTKLAENGKPTRTVGSKSIPWTFGAVLIGGLGLSLFVYTFLTDYTGESNLSSYGETQIIAKNFSESSQKITNQNSYWTEGYRPLVIEEVSDIEDELTIEKNAEAVTFEGYQGDIEQYYPIDNQHVAQVGEDILAFTEARLRTGINDPEEISMLLERAAVVSHKVRGQKRAQ